MVVVVSAVNGVEVNTRRMFAEAGKRGLARFLVINKLDGDNINFTDLLKTLRDTFGKGCVLFNAPINPGPKFSGVVGVLERRRAPAGCPVDLVAARSQLVDAVVEVDDALMEKYLTEGTISVEELAAALPKALAAGTIIPIFCTSVRKDKDIGVPELLDGLETYSLSPLQGPTAPGKQGRRRRSGVLKPDPSGEFVGQVFKAVTDKFVGNLSFLRVYQGTYKADQPLVNARTDKSRRTGGLFDDAGQQNDADRRKPIPGDIVAVTKVEDLHIGDTVGNHAAPAEAADAGVPDADVRPGGRAEGARRRAEDLRQPRQDRQRGPDVPRHARRPDA